MNKTIDFEEAKIWVGCLASYNNNLLHGEWFDLRDYEDRDEFYTAIQSFLEKLDKTEPLWGVYKREEWIFCDWENISDVFINQYGISPAFWKVCTLLEGEEKTKGEAFTLFISHHNYNLYEEDINKLYEIFESAYCGKYENEKAFARQDLETTYPDLPSHLIDYFDLTAYGNDIFTSSYWYEAGYVFQRMR